MLSRISGFTCALLALFAGTPALAADATLSGTDDSDMRVLIRSIDNGAILWVGGYQLGTSAKISPGPHTVSLMCEFGFPGGKELVPGDLTITIEDGKDYALTGVKAPGGERCDVSAKAQ